MSLTELGVLVELGFSIAAVRSDNWMPPSAIEFRDAGKNPASASRGSTCRGVGGGADGGVVPLWTKWQRDPYGQKPDVW